MEFFIFSRSETIHEEIVNESYTAHLNSDDSKLVNLHVRDNNIIVPVNSCIFRIFSPLLNSLLCETSSDVQDLDIFLPDFSADICTLMIEILTIGETSIKDDSKIKDLILLSNGIYMANWAYLELF